MNRFFKLYNNAKRMHLFRSKFTKRSTSSPGSSKSITRSFCEETELPKALIIRPILFTVAVGGTSFYLASKLREKRRNNLGLPTQHVRRHSSHSLVPSPVQFWNSLPEEKKAIGCLLGINTVVLLGWRFFPEIMRHHFTHNPFSKKVSTLLTSVFSHQSGAHFLFNMVALWSFGCPLYHYLGREYFFAFYLTSGVTASLGSHLFHAALKSPSLSLGASGALFGLLGIVYEQFPDTTLGLFFVIPVTTKTLIPAVAAFDVLGLTGLWHLFMRFKLDHAAHLSGLLAGIIFSKTMLQHQNRKKILDRIQYYKKKVQHLLTAK